MKKNALVLLSFLVISIVTTSCSSSGLPAFQTNDPQTEFNLFHLFDSYPALKAAWDSVPGATGNAKMTDMLKIDLDTGAEFMYILSYLLEQADGSGLGLLEDLKMTISLVNSDEQRLYGHSTDNDGNGIGSYYGESPAGEMTGDFYSFLDEITTDAGGDTPKISDSVLAMTRKIVDYILTKDTADIEETMDDLMADLTDSGFRDDFIDLMRFAAGPVAIGDFPMWIDRNATDEYAGDDELITGYDDMGTGYDSGLGNMSKGAVSFVYGAFNLLRGQSVDRAFMYDMIGRLDAVLNDAELVKRLIWNISNYCTENGAGYGTKNESSFDATGFANDVYNMDVDNMLFSDSEIRETLRELLPLAGGLFRRDDRISSMAYASMGTASQEYPLTWLLNNIDALYINWERTQFKESMYDLIRYDAHGRDRRENPEAYSASILEHLLFLGAITSNFGYHHLANAGELEDGNTGNPNNANGRGEFSGCLTLNDSLFAASTIGISNWSAIATGPTGDGELKGTLCRSKNYFIWDDGEPYRFRINWNYPILRCLSGPCAGDLGFPDGGNVPGGEGSAINSYRPYTPNGIGTTDLSTWTFALIARSCFEGEGPYYSTQGAQADGGTITFYRPDGSVYAVVDKSSGDEAAWVYTYPVDASASYDRADPDPGALGQRWNRFKPAWATDYYLIRYFGKNYTPADMTGNAAGAGCLTITETAIPNSERECESHEEAIFRNFQWAMNERKMVLVLPLNLLGFLPGCQIIEGNGITGLSMARAYRGNSIWAKANTGISPDVPDPGNPAMMLNTPESIAASLSVESSIPGDYRVIGLTSVGGVMAYDTLGRGSLTPAAIGQNIVALSRLAFPRSPLVASGTDYEHDLLGSRQVNNELENSDAGFLAWGSAAQPQGDVVWKKRNALIPLLFALIENLRIKSGLSNNAVGQMLAGLTPLIKPLVFFNYDVSDNLGVSGGIAGVAQNCWLPRIKGDDAANGAYRYPHAKHLTPDCYITGFLDPDDGTIVTDDDRRRAWYGGNLARDYFSPADKITLLSMLTDTETVESRPGLSSRADGLLAVLTSYTPGACGRPDGTMDAAAPDAPDSENIDRVLYGLEQITSGMKMEKSEAIRKIHEPMSANDSFYPGYIAKKQLDPPEWIFTKREGRNSAGLSADIDVEFLFETVVGDSSAVPAEGLLKYHETGGDVQYGNGIGDPDWTDLANGDDGVLDTLAVLSGNFLAEGAPHCISEHAFDIFDVMALHNPTEAQMKGLLYTLAKMLGYYDDESLVHGWIIQGEDGFLPLFDLLNGALPDIDAAIGDYSSGRGITRGRTYRDLLTAMNNATTPGGFVPWILDEVSIRPFTSGDFLNDLQLWLEGDLVSGPSTEFYSTLAQMLRDMGSAIEAAPTEEGLRMIYEYYGFQPL